MGVKGHSRIDSIERCLHAIYMSLKEESYLGGQNSDMPPVMRHVPAWATALIWVQPFTMGRYWGCGICQ